VGVHGMRRPAGDVDGAAGSDQRLTDDLAAEYALPADLRAAATEEVHLELFEVEDGEQVFDRGGHGGAPVRANRLDAPVSRRLAIAICTDKEGGACPRTQAVATCWSAAPALPALRSRLRSSRRSAPPTARRWRIPRSGAPSTIRGRPRSWRRRGGCSRPSACGRRSPTRRSRSSTCASPTAAS